MEQDPELKRMYFEQIKRIDDDLCDAFRGKPRSKNCSLIAAQ